MMYCDRFDPYLPLLQQLLSSLMCIKEQHNINWGARQSFLPDVNYDVYDMICIAIQACRLHSGKTDFRATDVF